jgi:hypothetical protein
MSCGREEIAMHPGKVHRNLAIIIMCRTVDDGERYLDFKQVKNTRGENHRRQQHSLLCWQR